MDVGAALGADREATELNQAGETALDHSAVTTQLNAPGDALAHDAAGFSELVELSPVKPIPDTGLLAVAQVIPEPQPSSGGSISQGEATVQDDEDSGQTGAVGDARQAALGLRRRGGQQWFDDRPEFIRNKRRARATPFRKLDSKVVTSA